MARVKCNACGNRYDYHENGCCPDCGAYNRPPQRDRVEADGTVHHMTDADFLENSDKRRRSQGGKVCFEQDHCFEEQARKVRGKSSARGKKSSTGKIFAIIIIVIIAVNILPVLLTMCSVSGVVGGIIDEVFDQEVGTAEPDYAPVPVDPENEMTQTIAVGQPFLWWEEDAVVTEVAMEEDGDLTTVELTVQQVKPIADPYVQYLLSDGSQVIASHDRMEQKDENEFIYSFTLHDRQPGSECYAVFVGENSNVWCEFLLPLTVSGESGGDAQVPADKDDRTETQKPDKVDPPAVTVPDNAVVGAGEEVAVGKTFLWWGKEARVQKASVHESGSSADVNMTMYRADSFDDPVLRYTTVHGGQMMAFCQKTSSLGSGQYSYYFHVSDRKAGTPCYALCSGYNDGVYSQIVVPLN